MGPIDIWPHTSALHFNKQILSPTSNHDLGLLWFQDVWQGISWFQLLHSHKTQQGCWWTGKLLHTIHENWILIYLMKGLQFLYSSFKGVEENASNTLLSMLNDYALHKIDKKLHAHALHSGRDWCIMEDAWMMNMHGKPTKVAWQSTYVRHWVSNLPMLLCICQQTRVNMLILRKWTSVFVLVHPKRHGIHSMSAATLKGP